MTKLDLKKIVTISVLLTFGFYLASQSFPSVNFWKYSIVSFFVFLILYFLNFIYEKYLWNSHWIIKKLFILVGFQEYPDISGTWEMQYFSSYKYDWGKSKYITKGNGIVKIKKIHGGFSYTGNFNKSDFKSSSNYFERNENNKSEWTLGYKYTNDPKETDLAQTGFVGHCGFSILNFDSENPKELSGFYGNDENRKTRGKMALTKK